jgi:hypothetical protein
VWNVAGPGVQAIQFDKTNVEFTVVDGSSLLTVFADSTDVVDNGDGTYTATFVNVVNPGFYFPAGDGYTVSDDGTITSVRTFNILCPTKVVPPTNPPTDTPKTPALASTNGVEGSEIAGGIGLGILLLGVGAALVIRRRKAATDHS